MAAIEFLPVIALAALGARTPRNAAALVLAVPGVYLLTGVQLEGEPLGVALAFANARAVRGLHRARPPGGAARRRSAGSTGWRRRCWSRAWSVTPIGGWAGAARVRRPGRAARGRRRRHLLLGDPLRLGPARDGRLPRATYALMVSLLPATATVIGIVVLTQIPSLAEARRRGARHRRGRAAPRAAGADARKALQRNEQGGRPRPVLAQEPRAGAAEQSSEHERDEDRVVELPHDRYEVRDEVEREGEVDEREAGEPASTSRTRADPRAAA